MFSIDSNCFISLNLVLSCKNGASMAFSEEKQRGQHRGKGKETNAERFKQKLLLTRNRFKVSSWDGVTVAKI